MNLKKLKLIVILNLLLISFLSCKHIENIPKIEELKRCLLYREGDQYKLICQKYKFDVIGGEVLTPSEETPIPEKLVCYSTSQWEKIANKRDEFLLWANDHKCEARN